MPGSQIAEILKSELLHFHLEKNLDSHLILQSMSGPAKSKKWGLVVMKARG